MANVSSSAHFQEKARANALCKNKYPNLIHVSYCLVFEYKEDLKNNTFFKTGTPIIGFLREKAYDPYILTCLENPCSGSILTPVHGPPNILHGPPVLCFATRRVSRCQGEGCSGCQGGAQSNITVYKNDIQATPTVVAYTIQFRLLTLTGTITQRQRKIIAFLKALPNVKIRNNDKENVSE